MRTLITITLSEIRVKVPSGSSQAQAQMIARAQVNGMQDDIYQEFKILMLKQDGDWKINLVEPLATFGR